MADTCETLVIRRAAELDGVPAGLLQDSLAIAHLARLAESERHDYVAAYEAWLNAAKIARRADMKATHLYIEQANRITELRVLGPGSGLGWHPDSRT